MEKKTPKQTCQNGIALEGRESVFRRESNFKVKLLQNEEIPLAQIFGGNPVRNKGDTRIKVEE